MTIVPYNDMQVVGILMSTNCAPLIVDLFCVDIIYQKQEREEHHKQGHEEHLYPEIGNNYFKIKSAGPRSAVGNVSGYRCVSDCSSRGREFDPGPVPYFRGD